MKHSIYIDLVIFTVNQKRNKEFMRRNVFVTKKLKGNIATKLAEIFTARPKVL